MNIGKLVLRKPDDRAPADSSTLPKALDHRPAPPRPVPPRPAPPRIAGDVNSKAVTCDRLPKLAQRGEGGGWGGRKVRVSIFWGMN